jgi:hypothetical protein
MKVPTTAPEFKRWADRVCGAWPADLQAKAYRAWRGLEKNSQDNLRVFTEAFDKFRGGYRRI